MKPLAERVREFRDTMPIMLGTERHDRARRDMVSEIIADLERLAEMLRDDGDPTCVNYVADKLAERKVPK